MSIAKYSLFLVVALCIDGFQFLISITISTVATFPGTTLGAAGGAAGGAYLCQDFGSWIISGCSAVGGLILGILGTPLNAAAPLTVPIGIALGFAISICISFTFGSMLVLFLQLFGMLDKKAALMTYMGEVLPGVSAFPIWTGLILRCAYTQAKHELVGGVVSSVATIAHHLALPNTPVGGAMQRGSQAASRTLGAPQRIEQGESAAARQDTIERKQVPMQDMRIKPATNPTYAKTA